MKWFYLKGQKTVGPLSLSELKQHLEQRSLGFFDQVCSEPDKEWQYVFECKALEPYLKEVSIDQSQEWIVLKDESLQIGPLSLAQIKQKIKGGEVSYRDFVWKEGLSQWVPIVEIDELATGRKCVLAQIEQEASLVGLANHKIEPNKNLIYQKRKSEVCEEEIPAEADGKDLVPQAWELV